MSHLISNTDLFRDCQLLFGPHVVSPNHFLNNLLPSELKAVYRKKAFETHPDRAKALGKIESIMHERFKEIISAYERLHTFIQNKNDFIIHEEYAPKKQHQNEKTRQKKNYEPTTQQKYKKTSSRQQKKREREREKAGYYYCGDIPKRKLLIGQYLFYSGIIPWRTLFDAIVWQRRQRPLIGQIALNWGFLTREEIREILTERSHKDKFAEYALRKGYISHFEYLAIRGRQRLLQRPIGEYFIEQKILTTQDMDEMIKKLHLQNKLYYKKN